MIVADVNLLAYLLIGGPFTDAAQAVMVRDSDWVAPRLWRHEFLNILATTVRAGVFDESHAKALWKAAPVFLDDAAEEPPAPEVLRHSIASRIATYDCEYVALAEMLGTRLVTADRRVLSAFSHVALSIEDFAAGQ